MPLSGAWICLGRLWVWVTVVEQEVRRKFSGDEDFYWTSQVVEPIQKSHTE